MKKIITILLSLTILFAAGCDYTTILSENQGLPFDENLVGTWKYGKDEDLINISINTQSENAVYAVRFSKKGEDTKNKEIGIIGYPIKIGDFYCVQLILQTKDDSEKKIYMVITYQVSDNKLIVKRLNSSLIGGDAKTSSDLKKLFFKYKDNPKLFTDWEIYQKVESSNKPVTTKPSVRKNN